MSTYKERLKKKAKMTTGQYIREQRVRFGLTQTMLADRIGYDQSTIAHIERGAFLPSPEIMGAIMAEIVD